MQKIYAMLTYQQAGTRYQVYRVSRVFKANVWENGSILEEGTNRNIQHLFQEAAHGYGQGQGIPSLLLFDRPDPLPFEELKKIAEENNESA